MMIAGAESEFTYKFPGAMALFDAVNVFHCSGHATARTLKLAFFVKLRSTTVLSSDDDNSLKEASPVSVKQEGASSSGVTKDDPDEAELEQNTEQNTEQNMEQNRAAAATAEADEDAAAPAASVAEILHEDTYNLLNESK